jgi:hypothetical protein
MGGGQGNFERRQKRRADNSSACCILRETKQPDKTWLRRGGNWDRKKPGHRRTCSWFWKQHKPTRHGCRLRIFEKTEEPRRHTTSVVKFLREERRAAGQTLVGAGGVLDRKEARPSADLDFIWEQNKPSRHRGGQSYFLDRTEGPRRHLFAFWCF